MPQIPKPDAIKIVQGTYRPDRQKPDIAGAFNPPDCPEWLTDRAKAHWTHTLDQLKALGIAVHPADQDALATYCTLFARQIDDPANFGPTMIGQLRAIWTQFGLTPAARENLGIDTKPKKPNPFK